VGAALAAIIAAKAAPTVKTTMKTLFFIAPLNVYVMAQLPVISYNGILFSYVSVFWSFVADFSSNQIGVT
jgi:hypothetical protein